MKFNCPKCLEPIEVYKIGIVETLAITSFIVKCPNVRCQSTIKIKIEVVN